MFYTPDHEWIDFQGSIAYIGISNFKLLGFEEIHEVKFNEPSQVKKKRDIIAWIRYYDYRIAVQMPIDGSIFQINELFLLKNMDRISEHLAKSGWIISIIPANPSDRNELIP